MRIEKSGVYHINVGGRPSNQVPFQISSLLGDISRKTRQVAKMLNMASPIRVINFNIDPRLLSANTRISDFRSLLDEYLLKLEVRIEGLREARSVPEQELEKLVVLDVRGMMSFKVNIDLSVGKIEYNFRHLGRAQ